MKLRNPIVLGLMAAASLCLGGIATAQEAQVAPGSERPMFAVLPPSLHPPRTQIEAATIPLQTWNGSFSYNGTNYSYNMVGVSPYSNPGGTASIPVVVIPVKIVLSNGSTFDPNHLLSNGNSVTGNTTASPLFTSSVDFTSSGQDMGTTQYIDAFQRANFWGAGSLTNYHLLLGSTTAKEQTLNPPKSYGTTGTVFGFKAGLVDINWFDKQAHTLLTNLGITPNTFAIFLTYDVYLTQHHSCCIGGYHSSTGSTSAPQSYAQATYVDKLGAFSQDVSALSHEIGEWADDPLVVNINGNNTPCGILEDGDPLENNPNYGAYPYTVGGFTYNLQDLTTLPYFGAPAGTSAGDEFTFQNEPLSVCQNGS